MFKLVNQLATIRYHKDKSRIFFMYDASNYEWLLLVSAQCELIFVGTLLVTTDASTPPSTRLPVP